MVAHYNVGFHLGPLSCVILLSSVSCLPSRPATKLFALTYHGEAEEGSVAKANRIIGETSKTPECLDNEKVSFAFLSLFLAVVGRVLLLCLPSG